MVCHDICVVFFFNTIIDLEPGYALVIQKPPFPQRATATLRTWIFFFFWWWFWQMFKMYLWLDHYTSTVVWRHCSCQQKSSENICNDRLSASTVNKDPVFWDENRKRRTQGGVIRDIFITIKSDVRPEETASAWVHFNSVTRASPLKFGPGACAFIRVTAETQILTGLETKVGSSYRHGPVWQI